MKTNLLSLLVLTLLNFNINISIGQDFESYYNQVIKSPNLKTELCNGRVQITHLYKQQIKTLYEGRDLNRNDFTNKYANEIYFPYTELWASFFNIEGFVEWLNEYWEVIHNPYHNGIKLPFKVDFDSVYQITSEKIKLLIQREPKGKWYLFYGTGGDMGGLTNGIMFANLITIGNKDDGKGFIFNLPHEINHQIYDEFNHEQDNLLRCFINEGLSCYLNYIYWDKKYSAAENIGFTDEEWEYSIENEAKIYDFAKDKLPSLDQDIRDKFHRWHYYIWENSPDRLAYFIGFRIVQAYVEKNGKDSWKEIYDLPLSEVISKSDYIKFITKRKDN